MAKRQPLALVLWGPGFDEVWAVNLVCGLRRAGVGVKLVGVQGRVLAGQQGLSLQPDLALGQVGRLLAPLACLALPCAAAYLTPLLTDPRLGELWQRALADKACFVLPADWPAAGLPPVAPERCLIFAPGVQRDPLVAQVMAALGSGDWRLQRVFPS